MTFATQYAVSFTVLAHLYILAKVLVVLKRKLCG